MTYIKPAEFFRGKICQPAAALLIFPDVNQPLRNVPVQTMTAPASCRTPLSVITPLTCRLLSRYHQQHPVSRSDSSGVQALLHDELIELFVGLSPWRPDSWSLAAIEHFEMYSGTVRCTRHLAAKRINLADKVTLGQTANRGLQLIWAIVSTLPVITRVRAPMRAEARAASTLHVLRRQR
jgi:hypothetical protein